MPEKNRKERVLFVDDEPSLLEGLRNRFRKVFDVTTAESGAEALKTMEGAESSFAVVVSDMRMPEMDGVQLLSTVKDKHPETVRIMLTGNADMETAVKAVNEGHIFRFINKPCPHELMRTVLDAAVRQHQLIIAEKDLLENTVRGSIQVLTDMLSLANPLAVSKTMRVKHYTAQIAAALNLSSIWQLEIAAMLSQIGCVTVPAAIMRKVFAGTTLSAEEQEILNTHPAVGRDLIAAIPRLEMIADMVAHQRSSFKVMKNDLSVDRAVVMGASILRGAIDLDELVSKSGSMETAVSVLERKCRNTGEYNPAVIEALATVRPFEADKERKTVRVDELKNGMTIAKDIRTKGGSLLIVKGHAVSPSIRMHLRHHCRQGNIGEMVDVWV